MSNQPTNTVLTDVAFDSLGLLPEVEAGLRDAGFSYCTPIQALTLPVALKGHDVAGQAQTGTGKTAAFLLVILQRLVRSNPKADRRHPRALVVAPTRELALQIHRDAEQLAGHTGLTLGLAYGGVDYDKQRDALLAGVDILIGTPGRLIDYYKQRVYHLDNAEIVVLDEADRMFDLGFIKDIRYLLRALPPVNERQAMMFSATLSYRVMELAFEHMNEPETLKVEAEQVTADNVQQSVYYPANPEKMPLLLSLLRSIDEGRIMVFTNTRAAADRVGRTLNANGIHAAVISGRVPQKKRQTLLKRFHDGEVPVLVATDVAARGLHIPDVTHVINFDLPQDAPDYVHRIGRTARLGAKGEAISFACEGYAFHLPDIEDYIGYRIPMGAVELDDLPDVKRPPPAPKSERRGRPSGGRRGGGGGGGGRKPGGGSPGRGGRRGRGRRSGSGGGDS